MKNAFTGVPVRARAPTYLDAEDAVPRFPPAFSHLQAPRSVAPVSAEIIVSNPETRRRQIPFIVVACVLPARAS
jgi:hypothetical protein